MPYHGIANGASGSLLSLRLCQTPVYGIPQMGEKEREEKKGVWGEMGCRLNKSMCRLEKTEFGEEFKSSGKRNQLSLGREETRSILATCCYVTNHPQSVLAV